MDQIKVVLPENTDYLGIEKEADYCTLVTCTPYAVNTHRLLVRGHRTDYVESEEVTAAVTESDEQAASTWTQEYIKGILISLFAAAVMTLCMVIFLPFRKRGKHERR
ncbi:MAG: sortase [Oscillospiraceae bacterium]